MNRSVAVIGGGITGLTAAFTLKKRGFDVRLFEANAALGGVIQTVSRDGFLCELGPNTLLLSKPEPSLLLRDLRILNTALEAAPNAKNRFVVQNGKLAALPTSPRDFLKTEVLSVKARWRALAEALIFRGRNPDETVAQWVERRFGREVLDEIMDPMVSGIYGGDVNELVVRHAFPKAYQLEQKHGSIIRAMIKGGTSRKRLVSWEAGLIQIVRALAERLDGMICTSSPVLKIVRSSFGFTVHAGEETREFGNVVLATPAGKTAELVRPLSSKVSALEKIPHASMTVVHLGFRSEMIGDSLNGFGALINRKQGLKTLGVLFSSTLFPGRAPEGCKLLTAFIGGRKADGQGDGGTQGSWELGDVVRTILREMGSVLKLKGDPCFRLVTKREKVIPQYDRGHDEVLKTCEGIEEALPGLYLIGNYRSGVSLEDCMVSGMKLGQRL
jgi:protoporphyrinogen/coproporphyrinogen III oxidase